MGFIPTCPANTYLLTRYRHGKVCTAYNTGVRDNALVSIKTNVNKELHLAARLKQSPSPCPYINI